MTINNVVIHNLGLPGSESWDSIKAHPDKQLIDATIRVALSWHEYSELLNADRKTRPNSIIDTRTALP